MFLRIRRSTTLLIVMMLLWRTKANYIMTKLDCSNSDQLCPGTDSITIKCTISNGYKILVWTVFKATIIDFINAPGLVKSQSHVLEGVTFNGELINDSITQYESTLTFNPSLATEEFSITCLSGNSNAYAQCQISFRDPPPAPTNLTSHYLHDSSEVLLSWTPPLLSTSIDLAYSITVTPPTSTDDALLFTTTNNSLTLDVSSFQRNVSYSVSINTITCNNSLPGENSTNSSFVIPRPDIIPVNGQEQIAIQPNSFTISFTVSPSVPSSSISWFFGSTDITNNDLNIFRQLSSDRLSLFLSVVQSTHEGLYTLKATDGMVTSEGTVRLSVESEPGFQTSPDDAKVHEHLNTTFKCSATGIPAPSITWLFNQQITIDTSQSDKYFISPFGNEDFGSLTIYNLEFSDGGTYTCLANNTHGFNTASATLEVQVLESPPSSITLSTVTTITPTTYGPSSLALSSSSITLTQSLSLYSVSITSSSTPMTETSINLTPAEIIGYIGIPASLVVILLLSLSAVSLFIWCRRKRNSSVANEMKTIEPSPANNENTYTTTISARSHYNSEQSESTSSIKKCRHNPIDCELQAYACASLPTSCLIEPSNLKLLEKVGQGEFGIVYRGILTKYKRNEQAITPVAIKTVKRIYSQSVLADHLIDEAEKMVHFNHYNVLSLTGVCFGLLESPCIIMPFMSNGSLLSYLRKESADLTVFESADENLILDTTKQLLSMCLQVAKGMVYLTDEKFVHRDLAARNCMISSDGVIKVADFGLAEDMYTSGYFKLSSDLNNESVKLPIKWMALESIHLETFNEKTDVWSYGVLCWEVFTIGRIPYAGISPKELIQLLDSGERLIKPSTPTCTDEIYSLFESCWRESPKKRPHFTDIVDSVEHLMIPLAKYIDFSLHLSQR